MKCLLARPFSLEIFPPQHTSEAILFCCRSDSEKRSLQNCAHDRTAVLLWHAQTTWSEKEDNCLILTAITSTQTSSSKQEPTTTLVTLVVERGNIDRQEWTYSKANVSSNLISDGQISSEMGPWKYEIRQDPHVCVSHWLVFSDSDLPRLNAVCSVIDMTTVALIWFHNNLIIHIQLHGLYRAFESNFRLQR